MSKSDGKLFDEKLSDKISKESVGRAYKHLRNDGIETFADLAKLRHIQILRYPDVGKITMRKIMDELAYRGASLTILDTKPKPVVTYFRVYRNSRRTCMIMEANKPFVPWDEVGYPDDWEHTTDFEVTI
jgi:hypothetical protein